jgi:fatty acid kinase fatty acid binding subunit
MVQEIGIVSDSGCDLPAQVLKELEIDIVPLTVNFGTDVYRDGEFPIEQFWQLAAGTHHPQTSQPAVGAFEAAFERLVAMGQRVVCVTITSKHSGTFNTARLAAQRFGEAVKVFDSLSLSLGQGIQAVAAAQAAKAGHSMQEVLALLEDVRARMRLIIVLDTLENLRRGGRADGFISIAERMVRALNIKVIINVDEGQLRLMGAARSLKGAMTRVITTIEQLGPPEHLAVAHTRNEQTAREMVEQLAQRTGFPREQIWMAEAGAALATHGGPGVIGAMAVPRV